MSPRGPTILEVQSLSGSGAYSLSTSLTPSSDPTQTLALPPNFQGTGYRADRRRRLHQQRRPRHRGPGRGSPGNRRWDVSGPARGRRARRPGCRAVRDRGRRLQQRSQARRGRCPRRIPIAFRSPWATATARSSRRRRSACRSPARPTRSWRATSATARPTWLSPSPERAVPRTTSSCSWAMATGPSPSRARSRSG